MDLGYWEAEVSEKMKKLKEDFDVLTGKKKGKKAPAPTVKQIIEMEQRIGQIETTSMKFFLYEFKIATMEEKSKYATQKENYEKTLKEMKNDLKYARMAAEKDELFGDAAQKANAAKGKGKDAAGAPPPSGKKGDVNDKRNKLIDDTKNIMEEGTSSLERTLKVAKESAAIGGQTAQKIQEQTEQMERIVDGLAEIDSELDRSKAQLNAFARRIASDRLVICFVFLIICGIIAIIVYSHFYPDAIDIPDAAKPPPVKTPSPTPQGRLLR